MLLQRVQLTVTCSPTKGIDHGVQIAMRLRALGHSVTIHIAARMVHDRAHLDNLLSALAAAGIDETFIVGGDISAALGLYSSALELLPLVHGHSHRPRTIGIPGYPDGHPRIDAGALKKALERKGAFADYITTQLCFNSNAVLEWVRRIRQAGIALPVVVELPGIVDRRKLLESAVRVGVGPSLAFLRKQGGLAALMRLSKGTLGNLHEALAPFVGHAQLDIRGFHYFTFNRLLDTGRWERAHSRGNADSETHQESAPK